MSIAEAYTYATNVLAKAKQANLSPKSEKDYIRVACHHVSEAILRQQFTADWDCPEPVLALESARATRSINTWRSCRNSLQHHYRNLLLDELSDFRASLALEGLSVDDANEVSRFDIRCKIYNLTYAAYSLELVLLAEPISLADRDPRHSKVKDLAGLPENPALIMIERCPKYRLAILAEAVTGCRPGEIEKGIGLKVVGQFLVVSISGLKSNGLNGQPLRVCSYKIDSSCQEIFLLAEEVRAGISTIKITSAARYSAALIKASKREWPQRNVSFSPYCLRHLAASDMKAGNLSPDEISAALGHSSTVTKGYYGRKALGRKRGGVAPSSVSASRPVRSPSRSTQSVEVPTIRFKPR